MKFDFTDTKLKIMILGSAWGHAYGPPERGPTEAFQRLDSSLREAPMVEEYLGNIGFPSYAWDAIGKGSVNTIFIDPYSISTRYVKEATEFIFKVRKSFPGIVFVLYFDFKRIENIYYANPKKPKEHLFAGERSRLAHYYKIDQNLVGEAFNKALDTTLKLCQVWLADYKASLRAPYEYDVALSFAGEDRPYADKLARCLSRNGIRVFYDSHETVKLWGKDLSAYLHTIYSEKARYCVVFISSSYATKMWTIHERRSAQERALKERENEYLLPIRIDDTPLPGLPGTISYLNIGLGIPNICKMLIYKLG